WVVVLFSRRYLDGDPEQRAYLRRLLLTLAAVSALASSNNLLTIALLWLCTSLSLHGLLTHFRGRPQAQIVAHKKFLLSRLADLFLLGAVVLVRSNVHTLELDRIFAAVSGSSSLEAALVGATLLIAASAVLKCAQLPFHGWLIQVMEAPTPVSALLHAGVVNIGGFLLIRLSPLMARSGAAQTLLLAAGTVTAVLAAIVMSTRISIKVMLAWSTCAQMGLMLVECSLGAYEVALLHLVAHSLYKAHAFLSAGGAVAQYRVAALSPARVRSGFGTWLVGAAISVLVVLGLGLPLGVDPFQTPGLWFPLLLLGLALPALFLGLPEQVDWLRRSLLGLSALGTALAYLLGHVAFAKLLPETQNLPLLEPWRAGAAAVGLILLFLLTAWLRARPDGAFARWLYPRAFGGFQLDELFTRLTFRLWPATLPTFRRSTLALAQPTEVSPR
ncbi:MAG: NADH-quinone oxidoreductase subunit L, partial [Myxococcales bacterium]